MSIKMPTLIPRPIGDLIFIPLALSWSINSMRNFKPGSAEAAIVGIFGGGCVTRPLAKTLIKSATRTAVVALCAITASSFSGSIPVALAIGSLVSLPTTLVLIGGGLASYGGASVIASLAAGSFTNLGFGLAALAAGWFTLENHDIFEFGIAEMALDSMAESLTTPLLNMFI